MGFILGEKTKAKIRCCVSVSLMVGGILRYLLDISESILLVQSLKYICTFNFSVTVIHCILNRTSWVLVIDQCDNISSSSCTFK